MNTTDAIRAVVSRSGMTNVQVSEACGRSKNWYSVVLSTRNDPGASSVAMVARACGHTLCIVPDSKVPKSAIVIDPAE